MWPGAFIGPLFFEKMTFKALTDLALSTCMNVFGSEIEYKPDNSSLTINISAVLILTL